MVAYRTGHARVVAGAGAGKTRVLVERAIGLYLEGVYPEHVLLLAYNRSAAETMRQRVANRVGAHIANRFAIATFHAWCLGQLRRWWPDAPQFMSGRLLGTAGAPSEASLAIPMIERMKLDVYWRDGLSAASITTEGLIDIGRPDAPKRIREISGLAATPDHVAFVREWTALKAREKLIEFADMLGVVAQSVLQQGTLDHVQALRRRYAHVMIDEGQDGNAARYVVGNWLSSFGGDFLRGRFPTMGDGLDVKGGTCRSSLIVGDFRQGIYGFTGAELDLFQDPDRDLLVLPTNYRSSVRVVAAGNAAVKGEAWNDDPRTASCVPRPGAPLGEAVQIWDDLKDVPEELDAVFSDIERRCRGLRPWSDVAVLARTNAILVSLELAAIARGVPVRIAGQAGGVWASSVGRCFLAYLRGAEGRVTWELVDVRNRPRRFLGKPELAAVVKGCLALAPACSLQEAVGQIPRPSQGLRRLSDDLDTLAALSWKARCNKIQQWLLAGESKGAMGGSDQDAAGALKALCDGAIELGSVEAIEKHQKAVAKAEKENSVLLSTVHKQKGAEFPIVYVSAVRAGVLPHKNAHDHDEELRLLYVAITRAEEVCVISTGGKPSVFLEKLR